MKSVVIAHQTVIDGDAVGNDILGMYSCLKQEGYDVSIFAENYMGIFDSFKAQRTKSLKATRDPATTVIYHHSIFWEDGMEFLMRCKGKLIFKFHNITPTEFFRDYSSTLYEKCAKGIEQTKEFIQIFNGSIWAACSSFSGDDLVKQGLDINSIVLLPPFNQLDLLDTIEPDFSIIQKLIMNKKNNILFVGRVAPNKGHIHLLKTIKEYTNMYDSNIHMWIIGPYDDSLRKYVDKLNSIIGQDNLHNNITFTGKLPLNQIKSYYLACDEYLCMSEHEGFCVPIIEAQNLMLPIVTTGKSALREIAGEGQVILSNYDYNFAASALFTIYSEREVSNFLQRKGHLNVTSRFSNAIIKEKFMKLFNK